MRKETGLPVEGITERETGSSTEIETDSADTSYNDATREVPPSEEFDLFSFFSTAGLQDDEQKNSESLEGIDPLLVQLQEDAAESVQSFSSRVNATTFAAGLQLTSGVFSALGSIIGSCGVFCAHGLGAFSPAGGASFSGGTSFGGWGAPGVSVDSAGNMKVEGSVDSIARATGFSPEGLAYGNYTAEDILAAFFQNFGFGISCAFGLNIFSSVLDMVLPSGEQKAA